MTSLPPVVFLCGHRKGGTTLFANLFDGHPDLAVYLTDISLLYGYFPQFVISDASREKRLERILLVMQVALTRLRDKHDLQQTLNVESLLDDLSRRLAVIDDLTDMGRVLRAVFEMWFGDSDSELSQRSWIVAKETSIEIYARQLDRWFPDCRIIQLVRDPRDNYAALKAGQTKHYHLFDESERHSLASLIHRARLGMQLAQPNRDLLGGERYLTIRFEDLTADAPSVMAGACDFLEIAKDETVHRPTVLAQGTAGNNYDGERFSQVTQRNVGRWAERISPFEAQVIEFHCREEMLAFGYEPVYSPDEQAAAAAEFYQWTNTRYFYRDSFAALAQNAATSTVKGAQ